MDVLFQFGKAIRHHRQALGLSQEELAYRAALDRTYISGIERGIRNPSLLSIARIAKALDIDIYVLFQTSLKLGQKKNEREE